MARIEQLIELIGDPALRAEVASEIVTLKRRREFGLVFERHIPETALLAGAPIQVGSTVIERRDPSNRPYRVVEVDGELLTVAPAGSGSANHRARTARGESQTLRTVARADVLLSKAVDEAVYPVLTPIGRIERGGDKPYHTVIMGENYHALELLLFALEGQVDCIYIDPPYNSGARDWKYNNNYVDENDAYRHSKWLAFMERRLQLAKRLLNPNDSALIVTIDEREIHRLGLLLQQTFPSANMQMVSTLINAKGTGRTNEFRRVDEYIFFLWFGDARLGRLPSTTENGTEDEESESPPAEDLDNGDGRANDAENLGRPGDPSTRSVEWQTFRRRDLASRRGTRKGGPRQFYPIYVNSATGYIEGAGDPLPHGAPRSDAPSREGCVAVFPVRSDGTEMNWSAIVPTFVDRWKKGYVRAGRATPDEPQKYIIQYLKSGPISDIEEGRAVITDRQPDGSIIAEYLEEIAKTPTTQWALRSHNAEHYGTGVLAALVPGRSFPFPKSLYAVEDAVRLFVADKPDAIVLDYFAGSGTTSHAVARLNHQDGGHRRSISITNNEVSADEADALRASGRAPGDPEWEALGIFEHIARPRIEAAVRGITHDGLPVAGDYRFVDRFPMADGLEENFEFFRIDYLDHLEIELGRRFGELMPTLWLAAGSRGRRAGLNLGRAFTVADDGSFGLLNRPSGVEGLLETVAERSDISHIFVVTDSEDAFAELADQLPRDVTVRMLPRDYIRAFRPSPEATG